MGEEEGKIRHGGMEGVRKRGAVRKRGKEVGKSEKWEWEEGGKTKGEGREKRGEGNKEREGKQTVM